MQEEEGSCELKRFLGPETTHPSHGQYSPEHGVHCCTVTCICVRAWRGVSDQYLSYQTAGTKSGSSKPRGLT